MNLQHRIESLVWLGKHLLSEPEELVDVLYRAKGQNQWFTIESSRKAIRSLATKLLNEDALYEYVEKYKLSSDNHHPKQVGIVMAGNLPAVGFHDWLCVYLSGNVALVKLSEKDNVILPYIWKLLEQQYPASEALTQTAERLNQADAFIATGSNNSARYFEHYFGHKPNIIRQNRNSIGVLTGSETDEQLWGLWEDVFNYYGLGCRNVSKLMVPEGHDFVRMLGLWDSRSSILEEQVKYKNNFDYNLALLLLNKVHHLANGSLIILQDRSPLSRIGVLHFETYFSESNLLARLEEDKDMIQCVVSGQPVDNISFVPFGESQRPGIFDYADGVDVMQFLKNI